MTELQNHDLSGTGAEHQSLLERLKGVFQGAVDYVETHLPEHADKPGLVQSLKDQWDTAAGIVKDDFEASVAAAKTVGETALGQAEGDVKQLVSEVAAPAEQAAQAVTTAATGTVQDVAAEVPTSAPSSSSAASPSRLHPDEYARKLRNRLRDNAENN